MVTQCQVERCNRCAMARAYPEQPEVRYPPAEGWAEVVAELRRLNAPLVAFGQTVFWDEPAKAVLRLILDREAPDLITVAGVHDSDYFSKLHGRGRAGEGFVLWSNNDWTHRDLWAAVGEITCLFGAEEPPHVTDLREVGVPLKQLAGPDPKSLDDFIDRATTAYGWRGVAQLGPVEQIARDVSVAAAGESLLELFTWGVQETIALLADPGVRAAAEKRAAELVSRLRSAIREMPEATVSEAYQRLIVEHYADLLRYRPELLHATATGDYLRFNRETATRPRFQALQAFLCHRVGACARETYDEAVRGEGMYQLDQFGEGAIPFDLVVPGRGRGTLRVLDTEVRAELSPEPLVIPTRERVVFLEDLAEVLEAALGPDVAIAGKALVGPVMFCSEAVLVLHEGASAYVPRTRFWLQELNKQCASMRTFPILRLRHRAYDALAATNVTLRLPEHLAEAFGAAEIPSREFGQRWREVIAEQERLLERLRAATSLKSLLPVVADERGDDWGQIAGELAQARHTLRATGAAIEERRTELRGVVAAERKARARRAELERLSGGLRRKEKQTGDPEPRRKVRRDLAELAPRLAACEQQRADLRRQIRALTGGEQATAARRTIQSIGLQAEQERLALARRALLTRHMELGNRRPTGWWFSVADPSGEWFEEAARLAEAWLEDLRTPPAET